MIFLFFSSLVSFFSDSYVSFSNGGDFLCVPLTFFGHITVTSIVGIVFQYHFCKSNFFPIFMKLSFNFTQSHC